MQTRQLCGARTRRGTSCIRRARANGRCPNHGGMSTGPRTVEGKANIATFQRNRWARWREAKLAYLVRMLGPPLITPYLHPEDTSRSDTKVALRADPARVMESYQPTLTSPQPGRVPLSNLGTLERNAARRIS